MQTVALTQYNLRAKSRMTKAFAQRPFCAQCAPAELLLRCRRHYCAAMATPMRSYLNAERTPSDVVCFEHAQSARRRSAFYAIPLRLLEMPLRCCGDACDYTARTSAFCIFLGRRGIAMRTPLWCEGVKPTQTMCL